MYVSELRALLRELPGEQEVLIRVTADGRTFKEHIMGWSYDDLDLILEVVEIETWESEH